MLENGGRIDPARIEDDIAVDGYQAVHTALTAMISEEITTEIDPADCGAGR